MAPPSTEQMAQLEAAMRHLTKAVQAAQTYLNGADPVAEVMSIHINFVTQRVLGIEKVVSSINRRNKNEDLVMPDEAEEASDLVRDLQIRRIELLREEKERERLHMALQEASTSTQHSAIHGVAPAQIVTVKPPLPPLPIPRFSGDSMLYNNFITVFDETIHKNEALADSQKLIYLQSYVDGEAKKLVGNILVTDANYEIARGLLQTNFGQICQNITTLYDRLHDVQKARNDPFSIRDTYNEVESILRTLEHAGVPVNTDQYLRHEVMKKWPWPLIRQIVRSTDMTLQAFRTELEKEVVLQVQLTQATGYVPHQQTVRTKPYADRSQRNQRTSSSGSAPTSGVAQPPYGRSTNSAPTSGVAQSSHPANKEDTTSQTGVIQEQQRYPQKSAHCPFCAEQHHAEECERYKTADQRLEKLGQKRCKKCFRQIHEGTPCIRNIKCRYCPSWEHNRALCPVKYGEQDPKYMFTEDERKADPPGLFMTLLAKVINPTTKQETGMRILLDPACNRTVMTEEAANRIGLQTFGFTKRAAKGMGDRQVESITEESVEISIEVQNEDPITVPVRLTKKIADDVPVFDLKKFRLDYPQCQQYYIPPSGAGCPIDLIIGSDKMIRLLTLQHSIFVADTCQLMSTKFGYLIMAENEDNQDKQKALNLFTNYENVIQVMCDLDLVGMRTLSEPDAEYEERALKIFYDSIKFIDGRYEVHWPWRHYPPQLNENYGLAMGRLKALLKKLAEQPNLLNAYHEIIQKQIQEKVVEEVPRGEEKGPVVHYIPHHAVVVLEKSTPVRPVYDASATVGKANSLNACMLKGTKWLGNTVGSLIRFRRYRNAITADIRHAFHQISIAPMDRDAVRFLWVYDPAKPPTGNNIRVLRFRRVAFGIVASPFLLYATMQYHLRKNQGQYTEILCTEMYADNLLVSLPHRIDVKDFYDVTKNLFSAMSMDITKWKANVRDLINHIPREDQIPETELSVLGLSWDSEGDTLGLRKPKIEHLLKENPTKRIVLKIMASIYDPLGWVAPFVLVVRIFLRGLWNAKKSWDTPLDKEEIRMWQTLIKEIATLNTVRIRRMYFTVECDEENSEIELHTFVDASAEAVGNVTYLRLSSTAPEIALVMAKSRLSPQSKLSIPRLEFYALVLGARVQNYLTEEMHLSSKIRRYIWSDSKCVLAWVASNKLLPVAIEKCLNEIRRIEIYQFRYVPTALNPADVVSRGALLSDLRASSWLQGPKWLVSALDWPPHVEISCEQQETALEISTPKQLFIQDEHKVDIPPPFSLKPEEFSEWKKLLRRTAYCIWLLHHKLQRKIFQVNTPIDYNRARMLWLRWDQRRNGSQNAEILKKINHFKEVQLFFDDFGVMRCKSRMVNSSLPWTAIEPIVLVKGSYITELIIIDIHQRNYHVGTAQTLATLRKHYWLIHGRREVYRIIRSKCYRCRRYKARPYKAPEIAPLPNFRITQTSHPFENTGVDVFGPIYIFVIEKEQKIKVKRWVLLLTCLVIRAVHLEVLVGLDTLDIICAIKRFTARRGTPTLMLSDNAPQFHLVNKCMKDLWKTFSEDEDSNRYFAETNITWKFTPPHAPWMGGAYERLVQVIKNAFQRTYCEITMNEREFLTTIVEVEGVVNNRPITYIDRDLSTPLLTPNRFLQVSFPAIPIDVNDRENLPLSTKETVLKFWRAAEEHMNVFWSIWSQQYLLALREIKNRSSKDGQHIPRVGDIVLMIDPQQRRGYWRKAAIERLIPSGDGKIRAAQIRLSSGARMIRPTTKLASLDLLDTLPEDSSSVGALVEDVDLQSTELAEIDEDRDPVVAIAPSPSSC